MSSISTWSKTAASNSSASPDGFPEGMPPSGVNDSAREVMASVRTQWEQAEWFDRGHTPTYVSATSFTIPTDVTADYSVNRRIKCVDATTLYGYISVSSYSSPNTTITVVLDSGSLSGSLASVELGILSPSDSIPEHVAKLANTNVFTGLNTLNKGADVASAAALPLISDGNYFDVTGTTDITSFDSLGVGSVIKLHFDDSLTLTHHATDLILPNGLDITTTAGDELEFVEYASGDWRCTASPNRSLLAEHEVTGSAATNIDFTGLDLDKHKSYRVEIEHLNNGVATAIISIYANGDYTATNYHSQFLQGVGTTTGAARTNASEISSMSAANQLSRATINVGYMTGRYFGAASQISRYIGSGVEVLGYVATKDAELTANLTSLRFSVGAAGGFGIGTKIRIYRGDV